MIAIAFTAVVCLICELTRNTNLGNNIACALKCGSSLTSATAYEIPYGGGEMVLAGPKMSTQVPPKRKNDESASFVVFWSYIMGPYEFHMMRMIFICTIRNSCATYEFHVVFVCHGTSEQREAHSCGIAVRE